MLILAAAQTRHIVPSVPCTGGYKKYNIQSKWVQYFLRYRLCFRHCKLVVSHETLTAVIQYLSN